MRRILIGGMLLLSIAAFGQERTPPAPPSLPALQREISGLLFSVRGNPSVALSHDQAQKLLPLLNRWKSADLSLPAADAQTIWNAVQTVLTDAQKAYKFETPRRKSGGPDNFGMNQQESAHDRQLRMLNRLLDRLSNL